MVVDDERQKGAEKLQGSGEKEKRAVLPGQIEEKEGDKPFWTQFLKSDYDAQPQGGLLDKVLDVFDGKATVDEIKQEDNQALEIY